MSVKHVVARVVEVALGGGLWPTGHEHRLDPRSHESVPLQVPQSGVEPLHPLGAAPHCALAAEHVRGSHVHEGHVGKRPVGSQKPVSRENPVPGAQALQVLPPGHFTHRDPTPPVEAQPGGHLPHGLVVASRPAAASFAAAVTLLASDAATSFLTSTSMAGSLATLTAEVPLVFHFHRLELIAAQGKGKPGRREPGCRPHRDCFCWSLATAAVLFFPARRPVFTLDRFFPLAAVNAASASAQATALRSHGETVPYPATHEHPGSLPAAVATAETAAESAPPGSRHCGTTQIAPDDAASAWALGAIVVRASQNFRSTDEFFGDEEDFPTERSDDAYADATSSRRPSGSSEDDIRKAAKSSSSSTSAASAAASATASSAATDAASELASSTARSTTSAPSWTLRLLRRRPGADGLLKRDAADLAAVALRSKALALARPAAARASSDVLLLPTTTESVTSGALAARTLPSSTGTATVPFGQLAPGTALARAAATAALALALAAAKPDACVASARRMPALASWLILAASSAAASEASTAA